MSYIFKKGATSQSVEVYIIDSTDGTPETGVLWNTAGIDLKYRRKDAVVVSITEAALTSPALTDTWEPGGFLEIGNGVYRLDLPDAALASASGIDRVVVFGTVIGMVVLPVTIHLTDFDLNSAAPNVNVASEDNIDFGAAKKTSLNAATTDLSAITGDKASYKATGFAVANDVTTAHSTTDGLLGTIAGYIDTEISAIKDVTDNLPNSGALTDIATNAARLTEVRAAVLTDWINDGRLDALLDLILEDTGTTLDALIKNVPTVAEFEARSDAAGTAATPAEVNEQVVDALNVDTYAEPGQEAPAATASLVKKIGYLYKFLRNKVTNDGTNIKVYNDAGAVVDQKDTVGESGGTVTRGKFGSGP